MDKFELKKYLYYGLVAVISLVVLVFVPMIGSDAELGFTLPKTPAAWAIYIVTKLLIAILNVLIFYCFMEQAKINVRNNEDYKKANEILKKIKVKEIIPRSPNKWNKQQWTTKGVTIFLSTALSTVALTNAILTYDYMSLLTYLLVITMGVIFGILQMKSAEAYWTNEYYQYALYYEDFISQKKITKKEIDKCLQSMENNLEILKSKSDKTNQTSDIF